MTPEERYQYEVDYMVEITRVWSDLIATQAKLRCEVERIAHLRQLQAVRVAEAHNATLTTQSA